MLAKNIVRRSLLIYDDMVVFGGSNIHAKPHAHHALEVILCRDLSVTVIYQDRHYAHVGVILRADERHQTLGEGNVIIIYLDTESTFSSQFNILLKDHGIVVLDDDLSRNLIDYIDGTMRETMPEHLVKDYLLKIFFPDHPLYPFSSLVDERITDLMMFIRDHLPKNVTMKDLTDRACLSQSRLFHLFKTEIGISIRKYILWCRIRLAIQLVIDGNSLTKAALQSGFADLAHLNRTFVFFFGVSPSHALKSFV